MVELRRLGKTFGPIVAVDDVSFTVGQGEVLGFLGPNGAGKSTTMKMITGFLTPTRGTVKVNGFDVQQQPLEAKKSLGYLPEGAPAYGEMTPLNFLVFIGEMRGFRGAELQRRVAETMEKVNLEGVAHQPIDTLSKGFKRRVGLAQAIVHDPSVLILDEPTDGLDPNQKHEVRGLIKTMARDKAIILSTHVLEEVHAVCTRAMIIAKGKVITDGTPAELEARSRWHNAVTPSTARAASPMACRRCWKGCPASREPKSSTRARRSRHIGSCRKTGNRSSARSAAARTGRDWDVVELSVDRGHLDEVFRSLTMPTQALT